MNINREDIQIITRNSNWSEIDILTILQDKIYNDKNNWQKFLSLFFISLLLQEYYFSLHLKKD